MDTLSDIVLVRASLLDELVAEARRLPGLECCGLLGGRDGVISVVLPARNLLASATAYEIVGLAAALSIVGAGLGHGRGTRPLALLRFACG
jgi:hypothetical protein